MAIAAKYKGDGSEFHSGISTRDLSDEEFSELTDEQKATLAASPLYVLRRDAPQDAAAAEKRIAREAAPADEAPAPARKGDRA